MLRAIVKLSPPCQAESHEVVSQFDCGRLTKAPATRRRLDRRGAKSGNSCQYDICPEPNVYADLIANDDGYWQQGEYRMKRRFIRFFHDEFGATAIEYDLIAAGISVGMITVVAGLGVEAEHDIHEGSDGAEIIPRCSPRASERYWRIAVLVARPVVDLGMGNFVTAPVTAPWPTAAWRARPSSSSRARRCRARRPCRWRDAADRRASGLPRQRASGGI